MAAADDSPARLCRFPVGETPMTPADAAEQLFCGDPADDACPYCTHHRSKAWKGQTVASKVLALIEKPRRAA
jgi:hypothetical protein